MRRVASRHGVNYDGRARQFQPEDFKKYDLVVAMDTRNKEDLVNLALTRDDIRKIVLLRDYDPYTIPGATVPDPYYGGMDDFEAVFQIISRSCQALLDKLQSEGIQTVEE